MGEADPNINDLKSLIRGGGVTEFTALGDVSAGSSVQPLTLGALSRTIVAEPADYGIVRSSRKTARVSGLARQYCGGSGAQVQFAFFSVTSTSPCEYSHLQAARTSNPPIARFTRVWPENDGHHSKQHSRRRLSSSVKTRRGYKPQTLSLPSKLQTGQHVKRFRQSRTPLPIKQVLSAPREPFCRQFGIAARRRGIQSGNGELA